jgi:hypothetical protein
MPPELSTNGAIVKMETKIVQNLNVCLIPEKKDLTGKKAQLQDPAFALKELANTGG